MGVKQRMVLVYLTARSAAQAKRIADALVDEQLAACVNILGPITSVYRWQGRVQRGREMAMLAKTRAALFPRLQKRVCELHDYEVPCVVAVTIADGLPAFLDWLARQTAPSRGVARRPGRTGSGSTSAASRP